MILLSVLFTLLQPTLTLASTGPGAPIEITAAVTEDVLNDFPKFLKGRMPAAVDTFSGPHSRRDVAELALFHRVLTLGGLKFTVKYVPVPSYQRGLIEIKKGNVDILANPSWHYDFQEADDVWISEPTIRQGEFTAGLYGKKETIEKLRGISRSELLKKRVATAFIWKADHQALIDAGFTNIVNGQDWQRLIRTVKHDRVELILSAFRPTHDLSFTEQGVTLIPLPGYRIQLDGERVWAVSRKSPHSELLSSALNKGLREARSQKLIHKVYTQSGFFNPKVADWLILEKSKQKGP